MLDFLYTAVSWVMLRWYWVLTHLGMNKDSGLTWALSIVLLVITARLLMFRLFVKQVHYQRRMQELQPQLQKIREKHKNDRQAMQREMMAFQQENNFNPLAGCLPMLIQLPIFLALFHVLRHLSHSQTALYSWTKAQTVSAHFADLWNAPISGSFNDSAQVIEGLGGTLTGTRSVILPLLILSAAATFLSQKLAMNRSATTPTGTAATVQKLMLYIIPLGVLASGLIFNFPLGVLIYWFTSNTWTLLQQMYINRVHPHVPIGADKEPTGEIGRTLAPKPGARPTRQGNRPQSAAAASDGSAATDAPGPSAKPTPGSGARSTPRPGARPAGGNRPANRPNKAKKRR